jgi:hypothetical protein
MYTTLKTLAVVAEVHIETVRRDARHGLVRVEKSPGINGYRIPVTGKKGANDYLRKKFPGKPLINP